MPVTICDDRRKLFLDNRQRTCSFKQWHYQYYYFNCSKPADSNILENPDVRLQTIVTLFQPVAVISVHGRSRCWSRWMYWRRGWKHRLTLDGASLVVSIRSLTNTCRQQWERNRLIGDHPDCRRLWTWLIAGHEEILVAWFSYWCPVTGVQTVTSYQIYKLWQIIWHLVFSRLTNRLN